jgi:hypothetical protein
MRKRHKYGWVSLDVPNTHTSSYYTRCYNNVQYIALIQKGSTWLIHKIQVFSSCLTCLIATSCPPHTVMTESIACPHHKTPPHRTHCPTPKSSFIPNSKFILPARLNPKKFPLALSKEPPQGSTSPPM